MRTINPHNLNARCCVSLEDRVRKAREVGFLLLVDVDERAFGDIGEMW